jgi:hypothetical protein
MTAAIAPDMNLFIKHFLQGWVLDLTPCHRAMHGAVERIRLRGKSELTRWTREFSD